MAFPCPPISLSSSSSVVVLPRDYGDLLTRSYKYRNSRTGGARSTRTQIDHDVFEGLPVRHWRKRATHINTVPEKENTNDMRVRNLAWPELEMPRDAQLLSEMSQNLLRAARMPQAKKMAAAPLLEDDKEPGEDDDVDGEIDTGFVAKRWAVMPKDMEVPDPEFLAKRRKGLPSIHDGAMSASGSMQQMRKTKIRKVDTSGNSSVLEVLVPEGQTVDGEIFEDEISPSQAPAPGTVVEGVGVVNAEGLVIAGDQAAPANNRRRPPPPKRKARGTGRSRKKRVAFAGADGKPTSSHVNRVPLRGASMEEGYLIDGSPGAPDQGTMMADNLTLQDGDPEGEEGSEEVSEGEEGEEGDEGEREEDELSPCASPSGSSLQPTLAAQIVPLHEPQNPPLEDSTHSLHAIPLTHTTKLNSEFVPEPVIEPTVDPVTEPIDQSMIEPELEPMDDTPDEMFDKPVEDVLDMSSSAVEVELSGELITETTINPADEQNILSGGSTEPLTTTSIETAQTSPSEPIEEPMIGLTMPNRSSTGVASTLAMSQNADQIPKETASAPPPDAVTQPPVAPVTPSSLEPVRKVQTEVTSEPSVDLTPEPEAELIQDSLTDTTLKSRAMSIHENLMEVTSGFRVGSTPEPSITAESEQKAEFIPGPSKEDPGAESPMEPAHESARESPVEIMLERAEEAGAQPILVAVGESTTEPDAKPMSAETSSLSMEFSADTMAQAAEESVPTPFDEVMPESLVHEAIERFAEPVEETTERNFSFTMPATSPKAPTPSPPTPIEDKFGLRAAYYSPKAPTMSPPTPIVGSIPSSPEVPLSEQHFQLPPQIDEVPEGDLAPALGMYNIPSADRITVESTRQGGPQLNAQIPVDHNPLDGMAAPNVIYSDDAGVREGEGEGSAHFSDGEEDLLGSLERSLDRREDGS